MDPLVVGRRKSDVWLMRAIIALLVVQSGFVLFVAWRLDQAIPTRRKRT